MTAVSGWLGQLASFIRLGRPLFLAGGLLLHGLGVLMALVAGSGLNLAALVWGQVAISAAQLMTHYSNEYFDLPADRLNQTPTRWAGGSRVLPRRTLRPRVALAATVVWALLGLAAGLAAAWTARPAPVVLPLMLLGMALALGYSAPPLRLHSRGLGELAVAAVVAGLTPLVGYVLQAGRLDAAPLLALPPLLLLQFSMMLVLEIPDAAGDAAAGKRTLVVRLGTPAAVRLHNAALLAAYLSLPLLVLAGLPPLVAAAAGLSAPVALWQGWRLGRGAWAVPGRWDSLSFWAIGLLMATAGAEVAAFLWLLQAG